MVQTFKQNFDISFFSLGSYRQQGIWPAINTLSISGILMFMRQQIVFQKSLFPKSFFLDNFLYFFCSFIHNPIAVTYCEMSCLMWLVKFTGFPCSIRKLLSPCCFKFMKCSERFRKMGITFTIKQNINKQF